MQAIKQARFRAESLKINSSQTTQQNFTNSTEISILEYAEKKYDPFLPTIRVKMYFIKRLNLGMACY